MPDTQMPDGLTPVPVDSSDELKNTAAALGASVNEMKDAVKKYGNPKSEKPNDSKQKSSAELAVENLAKKIPEFFEKNSDSIATNLLGPMNLIAKPLEEITGKSAGEMLKAGTGWIKNSVFSDKRTSPVKQNLLAKGGIIGAGFVYLAKALGGDTEGGGKSGGAGMGAFTGNVLGKMFPVSAIKQAVTTAMPFVAAALPAIAGVTAFGMMKKDDFSTGFGQMKEGNYLRGAETMLIGDRKGVDESQGGAPWKETGRQAVAYGAGALGIGTTAGAVSALAGGATLTGALGAGLAAAFPPALIAATVAGLAKGIQAGFVNNWDKRAKEITDETKAILADEDATFWDKTKAVVGTTGKAFFGTLVGGFRESADRAVERWGGLKDSVTGFLDKDKTFQEKFQSLTASAGGLVIDPIVGFFQGSGDTAKSWAENILPQGMLDAFGQVNTFFSNQYEATINRISKLRSFTKKFTDPVKETMGKMGEKVGGFFGDVKDRIGETVEDVKETTWYQKASSVFGSISDKFTDIFNSASGKITEYYDSAKETVTGFFTDSIAKIKDSAWFQSATTTLKSFGAMFAGFADEAKSKIADFGGSIKDGASAAWDWLRYSDLSDREGSLRKSLVGYFGEDTIKRTESNLDNGWFSGKRDHRALLTTEEGQQRIRELASTLAEEDRSRLLSQLKEISVNDAILTNDGRLIRTHEDDNIIATKNEPRFLTDEMRGTPGEAFSSPTDMKLMLQYLREMVEVLKAKEFQNIVTQGDTGPSLRESIMAAQLSRG